MLNDLMAGLDFRVLTDNLEDERSLTNEVWRTFLVAMALALLLEGLISMPPKRELPVVKGGGGKPNSNGAFSNGSSTENTQPEPAKAGT